VVISIIALLISLLLPALGAARQAARQMKNNSNTRSIHQALVTCAPSNQGRYPGLQQVAAPPAEEYQSWGDSKKEQWYYDTFTDGAKVETVEDWVRGDYVPTRFALLLEGDYISPEVAISPAE